MQQGSVLSPLLFITVTEKITEEEKKNYPRYLLYADDLELKVEAKRASYENLHTVCAVQSAVM